MEPTYTQCELPLACTVCESCTAHCRLKDPIKCGADVVKYVVAKFDRDSEEAITALGQLAWAIDRQQHCGIQAAQDEVRRLVGEKPSRPQ